MDMGGLVWLLYHFLFIRVGATILTRGAEGWDPMRVRLDAKTHAPCIDHDQHQLAKSHGWHRFSRAPKLSFKGWIEQRAYCMYIHIHKSYIIELRKGNEEDSTKKEETESHAPLGLAPTLEKLEGSWCARLEKAGEQRRRRQSQT